MERGREKWMIASVYNSAGWRKLEGELEDVIKENDKRKVIIGGDFNVRTGQLGGVNLEEGGMERRSKDKKVGNDSRALMKLLQKKRLVYVKRSN